MNRFHSSPPISQIATHLETILTKQTYFHRNRRWLIPVIAAAIFACIPELLALTTSSPAVLYPGWVTLIVLVLLSANLGYALMTTHTRSAKMFRYLGSAVAIAVIAHAFLS